jgi:hypothetical protein
MIAPTGPVVKPQDMGLWLDGRTMARGGLPAGPAPEQTATILLPNCLIREVTRRAHAVCERE